MLQSYALQAASGRKRSLLHTTGPIALETQLESQDRELASDRML